MLNHAKTVCKLFTPLVSEAVPCGHNSNGNRCTFFLFHVWKVHIIYCRCHQFCKEKQYKTKSKGHQFFKFVDASSNTIHVSNPAAWLIIFSNLDPRSQVIYLFILLVWPENKTKYQKLESDISWLKYVMVMKK